MSKERKPKTAQKVKKKKYFGFLMSPLEIAKCETELAQIMKTAAAQVVDVLSEFVSVDLPFCDGEGCQARATLEADESGALPPIEKAFAAFTYYLKSEVWRDRE
jgi:hypothetical protein